MCAEWSWTKTREHCGTWYQSGLGVVLEHLGHQGEEQESQQGPGEEHEDLLQYQLGQRVVREWQRAGEDARPLLAVLGDGESVEPVLWLPCKTQGAPL